MTDCKNCNYTDEYCASGDCTLGDNNLTEQMHKGELPYAEYYIKLGGGEYTNDVWDVGGWQSFNKKGDVVVEVLAPVPSYDEWKNFVDANTSLFDTVKMLEKDNFRLEKQNAELKDTIEALKSELKEVCDVLIRKCPEMKEWVMMNWKNLYEETEK